MNAPFAQLPDCDSIKGLALEGSIVHVQYEQSSGACYQISMTLPNALYLLSLLSNLPDADHTLEQARKFRAQRPSG
ncbi:MAG: hypothetical protein ACT4UQ_06915 [Gammaproteobacteria bacterium]